MKCLPCMAVNTAWFPGNGADVPEGLVVRIQDNNRYPWWGAAGALAIVPVNFSGDGKAAAAGHVKNASIVWPGAIIRLCPVKSTY